MKHGILTSPGRRGVIVREQADDADELIGNVWSTSNPSNDPNVTRRPDDADEWIGNVWSTSNPSNNPNGHT